MKKGDWVEYKLYRSPEPVVWTPVQVEAIGDDFVSIRFLGGLDVARVDPGRLRMASPAKSARNTPRKGRGALRKSNPGPDCGIWP